MAFTSGFDPTVANDSFTLTYFAWATDIQNGNNPIPNANQVNLDTVADGVNAGYQYTVVATVSETVDSCTGLGGPSGSCTFSVTGGTFNIYYNTTGTANIADGTGFVTPTDYSVRQSFRSGYDVQYRCEWEPIGDHYGLWIQPRNQSTYIKPDVAGATNRYHAAAWPRVFHQFYVANRIQRDALKYFDDHAI